MVLHVVSWKKEKSIFKKRAIDKIERERERERERNKICEHIEIRKNICFISKYRLMVTIFVKVFSFFFDVRKGYKLL